MAAESGLGEEGNPDADFGEDLEARSGGSGKLILFNIMNHDCCRAADGLVS